MQAKHSLFSAVYGHDANAPGLHPEIIRDREMPAPLGVRANAPSPEKCRNAAELAAETQLGEKPGTQDCRQAIYDAAAMLVEKASLDLGKTHGAEDVLKLASRVDFWTMELERGTARRTRLARLIRR